MEVCFGFSGWDFPNRLKQTTAVEPVDPIEGCMFDGFKAVPRAATVDDLGLEQTIDRLWCTTQRVPAPGQVRSRRSLENIWRNLSHLLHLLIGLSYCISAPIEHGAWGAAMQ
jgi:hypothetical protein